MDGKPFAQHADGTEVGAAFQAAREEPGPDTLKAQTSPDGWLFFGWAPS